MLAAGIAEAEQDAIYISVANATYCRLLVSATVQVGLRPRTLTATEMLTFAETHRPAMFIVDEQQVGALRHVPALNREFPDRMTAALVVVLSSGATMTPLLPRRDANQPYDGALVLPQTPAVLLAQLSVILYAHRAYVQRFGPAMEELQFHRGIFRSVTSGISVASATEKDFPLVYVNPAFEVMTGYSLEDVRGKNCRFLQGEDRDQPGLVQLREALRARQETVAILRNYKRDGTPFWNQLSLSLISDPNGHVTHFVGIQTDVSARITFEEALRDSEKLAAVGRLAASLAHEMNNPLATVINLVYLARNEEANAEKNELLDMAAVELNRVAVLTTQSLRFYRQSSKPTVVRPVDLLTEVLNVHAATLANRRVTLHRKDCACASIVCLESEIRQVLSTLLRNAMDALEEKPGSIFVRVREATAGEEATRGVLITVADTGTGMSPKTTQRLYTAFHTTKDRGGNGLGLWLSKEIVDRHKGRMRVRSRQRVPSGTVFQLFLPSHSVSA